MEDRKRVHLTSRRTESRGERPGGRTAKGSDYGGRGLSGGASDGRTSRRDIIVTRRRTGGRRQPFLVSSLALPWNPSYSGSGTKYLLV